MNTLIKFQPQQKNKVSNFQSKCNEQTAASAAQLASAFCFMLIHVQLLVPSCERTNKNFMAYLACWHNNSFGYKLTIEAENP